ncbi:FecR domain-containing protein [Treponema brennaborense]|uniref:FecR protein domain-containing protein n=1 Tax=Treponema brennaborense (strain DSM 12168 / CIP 105900 / DD5/3) TaxID=906968 RepID=F4LM80_TREBD|nr:FecR domain-containing protein [Treponema brennaborense]AEE17746.1 hypothetical protein Trebr_2337 [Treponema brennaborense DSM 12168]
MNKRLLLLCAAVLFVSGALWSQQAEVVSFTGKVEYDKDGVWTAVAAGDVLPQGTVISTGFKSSAVLKIGASRFTVEPLSRIAIEKIAENDGDYDSAMYVSSGKLNIDVKPVAGRKVNFQARSPVATASVRGTSGTFGADGSLKATSGTWAFSPAESPRDVAVKKGQTAVCAADGTVTGPQAAAAQAATAAKTATVTLAAKESVTPGVTTAAPTVAVESPAATGDTQTTLTVTVTIK